MTECRPHIFEQATSRPMDPRRNCGNCGDRSLTHPRHLKARDGRRRNQDNLIAIMASQYLQYCNNNEKDTDTYEEKTRV